MMLMVKKGTRNIAKKTRVRITIDTSIVVKVNLLVIKGYSTALLNDHFIVQPLCYWTALLNDHFIVRPLCCWTALLKDHFIV